MTFLKPEFHGEGNVYMKPEHMEYRQFVKPELTATPSGMRPKENKPPSLEKKTGDGADNIASSKKFY